MPPRAKKNENNFYILSILLTFFLFSFHFNAIFELLWGRREDDVNMVMSYNQWFTFLSGYVIEISFHSINNREVVSRVLHLLGFVTYAPSIEH